MTFRLTPNSSTRKTIAHNSRSPRRLLKTQATTYRLALGRRRKGTALPPDVAPSQTLGGRQEVAS